jgi:hypothetical protein
MLYSRWRANQQVGNDDEGLSILDLVNSSTLDCKLAALLWILMEQRTSVLVAAGPAFAGKTTLLNALLDFLPSDLQIISLQGYYEDFRFLNHSSPQKAYLVAEEISNHGFSEYLWGQKAVKTLNLLLQGYHLGATMHARTSEEAIYVLNKYLGLPLSLLSHLGIIVNLRATAGRRYEDEPVRRVSSVDLILHAKESLAIQVLAARQHGDDSINYLGEKDLQQALASKGLLEKCPVGEEIGRRTLFLKHLLETGHSSRQELLHAVAEYYRSKSK